MANVVVQGFRNVSRFKGRERRAVFWPYVGVVAFLTFAGVWLVMLPTMMGVFGAAAEAAKTHPESVTVTTGPTSYHVQIEGDALGYVPDFTPAFLGIGAVALVAIFLLGGSVCRRLHDRGLNGFWGLIPATLLIADLIGMSLIMPGFMMSDEPDLGPFFLIWFTGMVYNLTLIALVVVLALPGKRGPNRFGPDPKAPSPT